MQTTRLESPESGTYFYAKLYFYPCDHSFGHVAVSLHEAAVGSDGAAVTEKDKGVYYTVNGDALVREESIRYKVDPVVVQLKMQPKSAEEIGQIKSSCDAYSEGNKYRFLSNNCADFSKKILQLAGYTFFNSNSEHCVLSPLDLFNEIKTENFAVVGFMCSQLVIIQQNLFNAAHKVGGAQEEREAYDEIQKFFEKYGYKKEQRTLADMNIKPKAAVNIAEFKKDAISLLQKIEPILYKNHRLIDTAAFVVKNALLALATFGVGYGIASVAHKKCSGCYTFFHSNKAAHAIDVIKDVLEKEEMPSDSGKKKCGDMPSLEAILFSGSGI